MHTPHTQHCLLLSVCFMCLSVLNLRAAYDGWTVHAAYHDATKVVEFGGLIYVLSDGGLYSYDPTDTTIDTYDKASLLSDNGIFDIVANDATHQLVIIYSNGNIDLLNTKGQLYNLPDIKETSSLSDKTINSVATYADNVYISTPSGIVVVDTRRKVVANTYTLGYSVNCSMVDDGTIIALTSNGIYGGSLTDNLLDTGNWSKKSGWVFSRIINFDGTYYALSRSNRLMRINDKQRFYNQQVSDMTIKSLSIISGRLFCFGVDSVMIIGTDHAVTTIPNVGINHAILSQNTYWAACGTSGLCAYQLSSTGFSLTLSSIIPDSPMRNYFYKLQMYDGGRLLAVGGCLEYPSVQHTFTVMKYENKEWTTFEEETLHSQLGDFCFRNAFSIVQDPNDPEHHYVGGSIGIVEYKDYKYINLINHTNSPLTSILPQDRYDNFYVRTTGLNYDSQQNLWMFNNECDTIVRIRCADGQWLAYYSEAIARHPAFDRAIFDRRGWAWINSRMSGPSNNGGIYILDTNGTIRQRSDDRERFIYIITNQDGTTYQFNNLNCIVEDLDGAIWIGCNWGPFVTYEPQAVFDSDFRFTQPKVPRNDGTNYADYLLAEVEVRCIAVDGANRKWFGTMGSGVYLASADGSQILQHFTTQNSPLLSNDIYDIAIDGQSGQVYFATTDGLVSYTSDVTAPVAQLDADIIRIYPNPVRPDYQGSIIVRGLASDTDVKIVDAAGRLVCQGISTGGQFTWDGRTASGRHVASGVYYVLATDAEGNNGAAARFVVVR